MLPTRVIGTDRAPWHAYMAIEAAKARKDIALERPISLSVAEGRAIAEAVKLHNHVFRTDTEVPAEIGHRTASMCQIGWIAATLGQKLKWDPAAEKFASNDKANKLLTRPQRPPWKA